MTPETPQSATLGAVTNTPPWKFRVDPELRRQGMESAKAAGEDLSSLLRLGIQAIVVDPRAFIVACHNIIRGRQ